MGCSTCKQKNKGSDGMDIPDIDLIPKKILDGDYSGNFIFKAVGFVIITAAIPLIILALLVQLFFTLFAPKKLPKLVKTFKSGGNYFFKKYVEFKYKKSIRKRENQFADNKGYEQDSELTDIEVLDDITIYDNNKKK